MRREYVPVGKPAKRYSPAVSVGALRFNPVPWLTIVTSTPGTAAPLGSLMMPETVASWVCDHALTEMNATNIADNVYGRKLFLTWASPMINSLWFFVMTLSIRNAVYSTVRDGRTLFIRQLPNRVPRFR